jgi:SsrA-binding protein
MLSQNLLPMTQKSKSIISQNKKAAHNYFLYEQFEAGLVLQGWEVKSCRTNHCQIAESHITIKDQEVWLLNALISPLQSTCSHFTPMPTRNRKLLLKQKEINKLIGLTNQKGFTLVPTKLIWKNNWIKLLFSLAKGRKKHDKRARLKEQSWQRDKARAMKKENI